MTTLGDPAAAPTIVGPPKKKKSKRSRRKEPDEPETHITINDEEFEIIRDLGKGAYGNVQKIRDKDGTDYALKRVAFSASHGVPSDVIKEIDILRRFSVHPNIIGLYDYAWRKNEFLVLLEYGGMPLHRYIERVDRAERLQMLPMLFWQLLHALDYLHEHEICHRDVKPDNVLIEEFEVGASGRVIPYARLCDFGLSKHMVLKRNTPKISTLWYRAPENLQCLERYTYKVDVWAMGCVLYEYVTGEVLFMCNSKKEALKQIISCLGPLSDITYSRLHIDRKSLPRRWRKHSMRPIEDAKLKTLIQWMLTVDSEARPTIKDVLSDDYFFSHPRDIRAIKEFVDEEEEERRRAEEAAAQITVEDQPCPAFTPAVRKALVKWILKIQRIDDEEIQPQTAFIAVELFDEIMRKWGELDDQSDLKYIALTALNIAAKYMGYGLDLAFIYCWNYQSYHQSQGTKNPKEPSAEEIAEYEETINSFEYRCLFLLDFRIGGRHTALDRNEGNYQRACNEAIHGSATH